MATIYVKGTSQGESDWFALPEPDYNGGYEVTTNDVDASSTGRDNSGYMHRDRVGVKHTIKLKWSNRTPDVVASILNSKITDVFFNVQYWQPNTNSTATGTFYVGDRSAVAYSRDLFSSLTMDFVER